MNLFSIIFGSIITLLVITIFNIKKQQYQIMIYLFMLILFMIYYLVDTYVTKEKYISMHKLNEINNSLNNKILNEEQKKIDILRTFKVKQKQKKIRKHLCKKVKKIVLLQDSINSQKQLELEQNHVLNQKLDSVMNNRIHDRLYLNNKDKKLINNYYHQEDCVADGSCKI